jgi:signal transduction histidine kinase
MTDVPKPESHRLQALLETVRLLNSTLELKALTGIILEVVRGEIAVERISVFVVDRSQNLLRALIAQDMEGPEITVPIGVGVAGTVAATGEILDIIDAYADPRFARQFDRKSGYYTNDLFALPVCNREGEIVGVLQLLNRLRPITPSDREFLLGISVYIGLALENSFLHAQMLAREQRPDDQTAEIAHDTNDPLTFALGYLELATDERDLPATVWNHLQSVRKGIKGTAAAAVKFRESLAQQKPDLAPINLGEALRQLSEQQAETWDRNNIKTTLIAETAPPVYAYENEMRLVLSFLIKNAEAAVLRSNSTRQLRIHSWCTGKSVHVSIHHDGPAAESGASRGFAIANLIVQQYKGQILFESTPDKGTTFLIELPALSQSIRD